MNIDEIRHGLATQFKFKFYNDPAFPFLHSMGIFDVLQGFEYQGKPLGILHLKWDKEKRMWDEQGWLKALDAIYLAQEIQASKSYDEDKLIKANLLYMQSRLPEETSLVNKTVNNVLLN